MLLRKEQTDTEVQCIQTILLQMLLSYFDRPAEEPGVGTRICGRSLPRFSAATHQFIQVLNVEDQVAVNTGISIPLTLAGPGPYTVPIQPVGTHPVSRRVVRRPAKLSDFVYSNMSDKAQFCCRLCDSKVCNFQRINAAHSLYSSTTVLGRCVHHTDTSD